MPITTTVTTTSSGTTTVIDVRVNDSGPGGGDRYVDVVLSFDPTKLEQVGPNPADCTDIDTVRMKVWWRKLLPGLGSVTCSYSVRPNGGIPLLTSSMATLVVLDPVNSDMVSHLFFVGGGFSMIAAPSDRSTKAEAADRPVRALSGKKPKKKGPKGGGGIRPR
jgi:hypothetical protein